MKQYPSGTNYIRATVCGGSDPNSEYIVSRAFFLLSLSRKRTTFKTRECITRYTIECREDMAHVIVVCREFLPPKEDNM